MVNWISLVLFSEVIMSSMASQIASLTIFYSTVYSGADQRKPQSSASLVFKRGIHRWSVNTPHRGPVTQKMFPFDDVIMLQLQLYPHGFTQIDAVDPCKEMLALLEKKQIYNRIICDFLGTNKLLIEDGELIHHPWTKWPPFRRGCFQRQFHQWEVFYVD